MILTGRKQFKLRYFVLFLVLLLLIPVIYLFFPVIFDPSSDYIQRKGTIVKVTKTDEWQSGNNKHVDITLESSSGLIVDLSVLVPHGTNIARPLTVVLAGYGTGRKATKLLSGTKGIIVAAISYPYYGDTKINAIQQFLSNVKEIQQGIIDTAPAVLLALDYLVKQPYVNPQQVEMVGVSFGAFLASIPAAIDKRFKRLWLVQGAGDPAGVFEYYIGNGIENNLLRKLAAGLLEYVIAGHYLKPERWVGKIAPRPVIVINTENDVAFPENSVTTLHHALNQPNEIIWVKGRHVTPTRKDVINQLANLVFTRIAADYSLSW